MLAAVALAIVLVEVDARFPQEAFSRWPRLFGAGAAGARGLLSTVASSTITVAGVVFSITLVALTLASTQYSSRVLRTFTADRVNHVVLGSFLGIFAYCLVVLRTIRDGEEGAFVPSLAVFVGMLLAFVGLALLVWFIHHIATAIQASQLLAAIAVETLRSVDATHPPAEARVAGSGAKPGRHGVRDRAGCDQRDEADCELDPEPPALPGEPQVVAASTHGYLRSADIAGLIAFARERHGVVRLERRIGDFVVPGQPMVAVSAGVLSASERRQLRSMCTIGVQRTVEQDPAFGVRQLVDVALKALSPGVNDTTTAVMCIDYLTAILVQLGPRPVAVQHHDDDGEVRLITRGPTWARLVAGAVDQIRQNADANVTVLHALLEALATVGAATPAARRRRVLASHVGGVLDVVRRTVPSLMDRDRLERDGARTLATLGEVTTVVSATVT